MIKKCKTCGNEFECRGKACYCSEACKPKYNYKRRSCLFCHGYVPAEFRFCSVDCKRNYNNKVESAKRKIKPKKKQNINSFVKEIPEGMSYGKYVALMEAKAQGKKVFV